MPRKQKRGGTPSTLRPRTRPICKWSQAPETAAPRRVHFYLWLDVYDAAECSARDAAQMIKEINTFASGESNHITETQLMRNRHASLIHQGCPGETAAASSNLRASPNSAGLARVCPHDRRDSLFGIAAKIGIRNQCSELVPFEVAQAQRFARQCASSRSRKALPSLPALVPGCSAVSRVHLRSHRARVLLFARRR
jgi:hypothetical protein